MTVKVYIQIHLLSQILTQSILPFMYLLHPQKLMEL